MDWYYSKGRAISREKRGSADLIALWTGEVSTRGNCGVANAIGSMCRKPDDAVVWLRSDFDGHNYDSSLTQMHRRIVSYY